MCLAKREIFVEFIFFLQVLGEKLFFTETSFCGDCLLLGKILGVMLLYFLNNVLVVYTDIPYLGSIKHFLLLARMS